MTDNHKRLQRASATKDLSLQILLPQALILPIQKLRKSLKHKKTLAEKHKKSSTELYFE